MSEISFTLDDTQVKKKLNDLAKGVDNFEKPFNQIGDDLLDFYGNKVFSSQGSAIGERWRNLSPATLKLRANRQGYYSNPAITTDKILVWTGRLQRGFQKTVTKTKLIIENKVEYFKYHQAAKGRPPQRKMLSINSKVIETVIKRINEYAVSLTK